MVAADSLVNTMSKMKAAVYYASGDVRIEERDLPTPRVGEVLLKVLRSGMCGTDASEYASGPKIFATEKKHPVSGHIGPMILGHEFIGEIVGAAEKTLVFLRVMSWHLALGFRAASASGAEKSAQTSAINM